MRVVVWLAGGLRRAYAAGDLYRRLILVQIRAQLEYRVLTRRMLGLASRIISSPWRSTNLAAGPCQTMRTKSSSPSNSMAMLLDMK